MLHLPRIAALDLRSLHVIVAEHNARGGLRLGVWDPAYFQTSLKQARFKRN